MAYVNDEFLARWHSAYNQAGPQPQGPFVAPRGHVGSSKPVVRAFLRRGKLVRDYRRWTFAHGGQDMTNIIIPGEPQSGDNHWMATWTPTSSWQEVPPVISASLEQSFAENGIGRLTLVVENMFFKSKVGALGALYHELKRGYFSPWRGFTRPGLPDFQEKVPEWYGMLNRNVQLLVKAGYGPTTLCPVFTGLIDDTDLAASPGKITIMARDFGQILVDETLFLNNKTPSLPDPIVFADRFRADNVDDEGSIGPKDASSAHAGHPPRFARHPDVDPTRYGTAWWSTAHSDPNAIEWIQTRVPEGRYETAYVMPEHPGMEFFLGVYAKARKRDVARYNYDPIPEGWVDNGQGTVPGPNGGWRYTKFIPSISTDGEAPHLGGIFEIGDGSIIRLGVRKLQRTRDGAHRAAIKELHGLRRTRKEIAVEDKWVLVDDVSEIVMVLLRWAGFKEWIVERAGVRMDFPGSGSGNPNPNLVVNRGDHFIDVIKKVADTLGYVFFMGDPTTDENIGIPTFRASSVVRPNNAPDFLTGRPRSVHTIKDTQLLTGIDAKITDEPLAADIYVRGARQTKAGQGGVTLGSETTLRFQFHYRPPWSTDERLAGLGKYQVHYDNMLRDKESCRVACYLIALAAALASASAIVQIPANPAIEMDDKFYLVDESTGLVTRVWVANRSWSYQAGEAGHFTESLGGALVDTPDIVDITNEINARRTADGLKFPPVGPTGGTAAPL